MTFTIENWGPGNLTPTPNFIGTMFFFSRGNPKKYVSIHFHTFPACLNPPQKWVPFNDPCWYWFHLALGRFHPEVRTPPKGFFLLTWWFQTPKHWKQHAGQVGSWSCRTCFIIVSGNIPKPQKSLKPPPSFCSNRFVGDVRLGGFVWKTQFFTTALFFQVLREVYHLEKIDGDRQTPWVLVYHGPLLFCHQPWEWDRSPPDFSGQICTPMFSLPTSSIWAAKKTQGPLLSIESGLFNLDP